MFTEGLKRSSLTKANRFQIHLQMKNGEAEQEAEKKMLSLTREAGITHP